MSKTSIPEKVKLQVVARAGGRCEFRGCNQALDVENLTGTSGRYSHFAHIVADSAEGPRGDAARSKALADKAANLMLLCFDHHRLIDEDDEAGHPETLLLTFKQEHEDRIRHLLSLDVSHRTKLLTLNVPIGMRQVAVDHEAARLAILPRYPLRETSTIDLGHLTLREDDPTFWSLLPGEIQRQAERAIARVHGEPEWHSLSVFALAPIPLLLQLGRMLGDIRTVHVHQKLRSPDSWLWQEPAPSDVTFELRPPATISVRASVALLMSLSGTVHANEADAIADFGGQHWELRASVPAVDSVRTRGQLDDLGRLWRQALTAIRETYGADVGVHLFPAIPNSVAIECGRLLLPKADPVIRIYDRQPSGFVPRGTLNERPTSVRT